MFLKALNELYPAPRVKKITRLVIAVEIGPKHGRSTASHVGIAPTRIMPQPALT